MELKVFWRTLRRRWYLTVVVLALTVGATGYVVLQVGPDYQAEGSALVFPPSSSVRKDGAVETEGNPYLALSGVSQARDVVIRALKSRSVQTEWGERFPGMEYEVTPDFTNSAPIILFEVEGGSADGAVTALDDLMARVPQTLQDLQGGLGLRQDGFVTARRLTQDSQPAVVRKSQVRAGLMAGAVTAGIGLLLLALLDSLLTARARSRAGRRAAVAVAEPVVEQGEETHAPSTEPDLDAKGDEAGTADEPAPVYTSRVPSESDLAVSPARSRWQLATPSAASAQELHQFRLTSSGTKPRARASSRNR